MRFLSRVQVALFATVLLAVSAAFAVVPTVSIDGNQLVVQANATVTTSSSVIVTGFNNRQVDLLVNIKASPTGTTPTITYSLQEVDPGDKTTVIGAPSSTLPLNSITNAQLSINASLSPYIKVSWTVAGASASFTQVFATMRSKPDPNPGNSSSSGTITAACADPGTACASGTFVSINTAGQFGSFVHIPSTNNIVGTLKAECSGDGTTWNLADFNDGVNAKSSIKTLASGVGFDASIIGCVGQQVSRVRLSVLSSGSSTGLIQMTASLALNDTVRAQLVSPANADITGGSTSALVDPLGWLKVSMPSGLFIDPFDGSTVDVTDRWTTAVAGAGGAISQANGILTLATTTTVSAKSNAVSKPTFLNSGGSALQFSANIKLDTTTLPTNVDRFWGWATVPVTPTYAAPITDGVGFELKDTTLTAAVYSAGTKTTVATLTAKTDGAWHRYRVQRRSDLYVWYIDDFDTPVASSQFVIPAVQTLPVALAMINNTSAASGSPTFQVTSVTVAENTNTNIQVSDGQFPWRQQKVEPTFGASRTTIRPMEVLGCYAIGGSVAYTAVTAGGIVFSMRWGAAAPNIALILRVEVMVIVSAFTAASIVERQLVVVRSFTASDTGGTAVTPAANQNELRTSFPTSLLTDARFGGFLTAGTGTADTNPVATVGNWMSAIGNVIGAGRTVSLFDATSGVHYPLVLATNEGIRVRLNAAEGASTRQTFVNVVWCEATAY